MFAGKRQEEIAEEVRRKGSVRVRDLARKYEVSEDLIRKDLSRLERNGKLRKVYGGAMSVRENLHRHAVEEREALYIEEREKIAEKAMDLIRPGMTVFLDTSVTCTAVAKAIRESDISLCAVTDMIAVMEELISAKQVRLVMAAGAINETRDAFWSIQAYETAVSYRYDLALIGIAAADLQNGWLFTYEEEDGRLKKAVMDRAKKCVILCESHKLEEEGDYIFASLKDADLLLLGRDPKRAEITAAGRFETEVR